MTQAKITGNFWNLEERKSLPQAVCAVLYFALILFLIDGVFGAIVLNMDLPAEARHWFERLSPSIFMGIALTALVMIARVAPAWQKILALAISAGGGFFLHTLAALLPLLYLLTTPMTAGKGREESAPESTAAAVSSPVSADGDGDDGAREKTTAGADPLAAFITHKKKP